VQNLSLSKLRELQASGEISDVAFCAMLLRLSQAEAGRGLNDVSVDAVEFQHAMCLARGQSSPWTSSLGAGVCAAALSFLRRGVSKAGEAPAMAEKLIQVASRSTSFVSTLAINLYFKLQLPDDKVAAHVPQFLALLGEADAATEGLSSARRPGCLAMASCL
ncbi:GIP, partial [Symbiodinium sp. CCMP2456]